MTDDGASSLARAAITIALILAVVALILKGYGTWLVWVLLLLCVVLL